MRTFALAVLALGANAWTRAYRSDLDAALESYQPIEDIDLDGDYEIRAYAPALTESTRAERITDRVLWDKLTAVNGLERYTHAHHGTDRNDQGPTEDHIYPEEHAHYREITYNERQPVIVNQDRIVYHVTPTRYTREGYEDEEEELEYEENYYFPTMKPDNLTTAKQARAFRTRTGLGAGFGLDTGETGLVHLLNPVP